MRYRYGDLPAYMVQGAAGAALAMTYPNDAKVVAAVRAANGGVIPNADGSIPGAGGVYPSAMTPAQLAQIAQAAQAANTGTYLLIGGVVIAGLIGVMALRKKKGSAAK